MTWLPRVAVRFGPTELIWNNDHFAYVGDREQPEPLLKGEKLLTFHSPLLSNILDLDLIFLYTCYIFVTFETIFVFFSFKSSPPPSSLFCL